MFVVVESSAKFQSESQSADNSEIGPYITEEVSAAVVVLAQQSVGHRVGIECSEVVILSLESVGSIGVLTGTLGCWSRAVRIILPLSIVLVCLVRASEALSPIESHFVILVSRFTRPENLSKSEPIAIPSWPR